MALRGKIIVIDFQKFKISKILTCGGEKRTQSQDPTRPPDAPNGRRATGRPHAGRQRKRAGCHQHRLFVSSLLLNILS